MFMCSKLSDDMIRRTEKQIQVTARRCWTAVRCSQSLARSPFYFFHAIFILVSTFKTDLTTLYHFPDFKSLFTSNQKGIKRGFSVNMDDTGKITNLIETANEYGYYKWWKSFLLWWFISDPLYATSRFIYLSQYLEQIHSIWVSFL